MNLKQSRGQLGAPFIVYLCMFNHLSPTIIFTFFSELCYDVVFLAKTITYSHGTVYDV